ncbi:MAG: hypothetical protein LQ338_004219 [Usnochroma carphineum]|nr:MAG: hypothetical protein LQ338_004219 [Usnochroma carphineum]
MASSIRSTTTTATATNSSVSVETPSPPFLSHGSPSPRSLSKETPPPPPEIGTAIERISADTLPPSGHEDKGKGKANEKENSPQPLSEKDYDWAPDENGMMVPHLITYTGKGKGREQDFPPPPPTVGVAPASFPAHRAAAASSSAVPDARGRCSISRLLNADPEAEEAAATLVQASRADNTDFDSAVQAANVLVDLARRERERTWLEKGKVRYVVCHGKRVRVLMEEGDAAAAAAAGRGVGDADADDEGEGAGHRNVKDFEGETTCQLCRGTYKSDVFGRKVGAGRSRSASAIRKSALRILLDCPVVDDDDEGDMTEAVDEDAEDDVEGGRWGAAKYDGRKYAREWEFGVTVEGDMRVGGKRGRAQEKEKQVIVDLTVPPTRPIIDLTAPPMDNGIVGSSSSSSTTGSTTGCPVADLVKSGADLLPTDPNASIPLFDPFDTATHETMKNWCRRGHYITGLPEKILNPRERPSKLKKERVPIEEVLKMEPKVPMKTISWKRKIDGNPTTTTARLAARATEEFKRMFPDDERNVGDGNGMGKGKKRKKGKVEEEEVGMEDEDGMDATTPAPRIKKRRVGTSVGDAGTDWERAQPTPTPTPKPSGFTAINKPVEEETEAPVADLGMRMLMSEGAWDRRTKPKPAKVKAVKSVAERGESSRQGGQPAMMMMSGALPAPQEKAETTSSGRVSRRPRRLDD